jgi:hypothetical protein
MRELAEQEITQYATAVKENGFAIMEGAIEEGLCKDILAELERLEAVRPGGDIPPGPFTGFVTRRWFDLLNDGDVWQQVAINRWVMQVLPHLLGEEFLLSTMGSAVIGPGEEAQDLHVDDGVYQFPRPHPNLVCNTMWALSDFTEETGGTRLVRGSNNWDHDPQPGETYESIPLEMPAGSIAFVIGTCYHGAGTNTTDETRWALTINYCNGSMRQQENLMLGVRPDRMLTFPAELQDILGFKLCKGAGHIFASDPRVELARRYAKWDKQDPYLQQRNELHRERIGNPIVSRDPGVDRGRANR